MSSLTCVTRSRGMRSVVFGSLLPWMIGCGESSEESRLENESGRFSSIIHEDRTAYEGAKRLRLVPQQQVCDGSADTSCTFIDIRVALVKSDGEVLLGDGLSDLRQFGRDGFVRRVGGEGHGPGEFRTSMAAGVNHNDDLTVFDIRSFRVSYFDSSGTFISGRDLEFSTTFSGIDILNGEPVILEIPGSDSIGSMVTARFVRYSGTDDRPGELARVSARSRTRPGSDLAPMPTPFEAKPAWDVGATGLIAFTTGDAYRIEIHDGTARPGILLVSDISPDALSTAAQDSARRALLLPGGRRSSSTAYSQEAERRLNALPKHYPAISTIRILRDSTLWVRRYPAVDQVDVRWDAFDSGGRRLGFVELPVESNIADGSMQRMLLVEHDSLGIASATWYAVEGHRR